MNDSVVLTDRLAGRFRRLAATLIDAVLVPSLAFLLIMVAGVLEDAEDYQDSLWMLWVLLLAIASYLLLNGYTLWRSGQTLGKKILRIAIVAAAEGDSGAARPPLWKLIFIRAWFFALLFTLPLLLVFPIYGLLPVVDQAFIFGKRRRCLHDLVSGTIVVSVESR
jgi:uncharacterized RDD family membrane protein YckC